MFFISRAGRGTRVALAGGDPAGLHGCRDRPPRGALAQADHPRRCAAPETASKIPETGIPANGRRRTNGRQHPLQIQETGRGMTRGGRPGWFRSFRSDRSRPSRLAPTTGRSGRAPSSVAWSVPGPAWTTIPHSSATPSRILALNPRRAAPQSAARSRETRKERRRRLHAQRAKPLSEDPRRLSPEGGRPPAVTANSPTVCNGLIL